MRQVRAGPGHHDHLAHPPEPRVTQQPTPDLLRRLYLLVVILHSTRRVHLAVITALAR